MSAAAVRVLIVDDEEITASAHAAYVERLAGFAVAGVAHTGHEAIRLLRESASALPALHQPAASASTPHVAPTPNTSAQPTRDTSAAASAPPPTTPPPPAPHATAAASAPPPTTSQPPAPHTPAAASTPPPTAPQPPAPQASAAASAPPPPGAGGRAGAIELILLDMNLPDTHGLDLCRQIRSAGLDIDVIAITAVREVGVVRASVSLGIVQYLIKPFTFATFADRMRSYLDFRRSFDDGRLLATQGDVDHTLGALRTVAPAAYDKGLSEGTLQLVVNALAAAPSALSASELSESAAISRVTARRYLEHLVASGAASKSARYGAPGRPELEYRLAPPAR